MILEVKCPECAAPIQQDITLAGTLCSCPKCHSNYTAPATNIVAGTKLGDYWIQKRLGGSIRSDVFIAKDLKGGHRLALKVFSPLVNLTEDNAKKYFATFEAPIFGTTAGIIQPRSVGVVSGFAYTATDFIQGEDLRTHLKRVGTFPELKLVEIAESCAETLDLVWSATNRFHGHLRPGNIMFTQGDKVVLIDFGLDLLMVDAENSAAYDPKLAPYRSPEQNRGERGDCRSDMYSLGASLYFLATGAKPLAAGSASTLLLDDGDSLMPPLCEVNQNISEKFSQLTAKLLDMDKEKRPNSWQTFLNEIREFKSSQLSTQILRPEMRPVIPVEPEPEPTPEPEPQPTTGNRRNKAGVGSSQKQRAAIRRSLVERARGRDTGIPTWVVLMLLVVIVALCGIFVAMVYLASG